MERLLHWMSQLGALEIGLLAFIALNALALALLLRFVLLAAFSAFKVFLYDLFHW